ncbi:uncharacterized protein BDV14DRAFT_90756 [Aspergillus stella-maris]|uniref:uncharacterized protein n=1 Tax=Aspergillus stella-maris TaxID=1810926 RepID=UPI003CCD2D7B
MSSIRRLRNLAPVAHQLMFDLAQVEKPDAIRLLFVGSFALSHYAQSVPETNVGLPIHRTQCFSKQKLTRTGISRNSTSLSICLISLMMSGISVDAYPMLLSVTIRRTTRLECVRWRRPRESPSSSIRKKLTWLDTASMKRAFDADANREIPFATPEDLVTEIVSSTKSRPASIQRQTAVEQLEKIARHVSQRHENVDYSPAQRQRIARDMLWLAMVNEWNAASWKDNLRLPHERSLAPAQKIEANSQSHTTNPAAGTEYLNKDTTVQGEKGGAFVLRLHDAQLLLFLHFLSGFLCGIAFSFLVVLWLAPSFTSAF